MSDAIQQAIGTLTELKRLHQLNFELIEQLNISCQYIVDNNIKVPNESHLRSLVSKSLALIAELQGKTPKTLIYKKIGTDEFSHEPQNSQGLHSTFLDPL